MSLHLPFPAALILGVAGIVAANVFGTVETLAVTRDKPRLAGAMSALGVLAGIVVSVSAVGSVLIYGVSWRAGLVVMLVVVASYVSTVVSTERAGRAVRIAVRLLRPGR